VSERERRERRESDKERGGKTDDLALTLHKNYRSRFFPMAVFFHILIGF